MFLIKAAFLLSLIVTLGLKTTEAGRIDTEKHKKSKYDLTVDKAIEVVSDSADKEAKEVKAEEVDGEEAHEEVKAEVDAGSTDKGGNEEEKVEQGATDSTEKDANEKAQTPIQEKIDAIGPSLTRNDAEKLAREEWQLEVQREEALIRAMESRGDRNARHSRESLEDRVANINLAGRVDELMKSGPIPVVTSGGRMYKKTMGLCGGLRVPRYSLLHQFNTDIKVGKFVGKSRELLEVKFKGEVVGYHPEFDPGHLYVTGDDASICLKMCEVRQCSAVQVQEKTRRFSITEDIDSGYDCTFFLSTSRTPANPWVTCFAKQAEEAKADKAATEMGAVERTASEEAAVVLAAAEKAASEQEAIAKAAFEKASEKAAADQVASAKAASAKAAAEKAAAEQTAAAEAAAEKPAPEREAAEMAAAGAAAEEAAEGSRKRLYMLAHQGGQEPRNAEVGEEAESVFLDPKKPKNSANAKNSALCIAAALMIIEMA